MGGKVRRFRIPEVVLGALLMIAIFVIGFVFETLPHSSSSTQIEGASKTNNSGNAHVKQKNWWNEPVADFTLGLIIVGLFQVGLFYVQLTLIRESLDDAKLAADAAKEAADAAKSQAKVAERSLTELERPWIFIDLSANLQGSPDDEVEEPYALFDIVNHGRGPAIINEFHGEISSAEMRPDAPILRDEFHGTVGPGKAMKECKIHCPVGLKYDLSVDPTYDPGPSFPIPKPTQENWEIFIRMLIDYVDIVGNSHTSAYCWRYDRGVVRWVKFEEEPGNSQYNYLT